MDWRYNTIWFEQLKADIFYQQNLDETLKSDIKLVNIEYAILWHLKESDKLPESLTTSDNLLYLELNSVSIKNLQIIEKLNSLKRLELHYCTKLENDTGIAGLKNTLEILHINQSKKFVFTEELLQLENLRVLRINSCAPIENLEFLKYLPNLIDFRFVNTTIVNGDLEPILIHPTISTVGFSNKRHYNFKDIELEEKLNLKSNREYKTYKYKGDYQTFRYDY